MRFLLSLFACAFFAAAQPSALLDDLEQRAIAALNRIPHAENWQEIERTRAAFRVQLEDAIGLGWAPAGRPVSAFVYTPKNLTGRVAAAVVLRPHTNPTESEAKVLPSALAQLGLFVIEVDTRLDHSRLDLLADGHYSSGADTAECAFRIGFSEVERSCGSQPNRSSVERVSPVRSRRQSTLILRLLSCSAACPISTC